MGWISIDKEGVIKREEDTFINERGEVEGVGRPVQQGEEGNLLIIAQEDYGHRIAVDLVNGIIALDYDKIEKNEETGRATVVNARFPLFVCEETNVVGDYKHLKSVFEPFYNCMKTKFVDTEIELRDDEGNFILDENGEHTYKLNEDGTRATEKREVPCEYGSTRPDELCENGHRRRPVMVPDNAGNPDSPLHHAKVRTDTEYPITWRPIWFTRRTYGQPDSKIIGLQTTTPEQYGGRNVQKKVILFADGRVGID